MDSCGEPKVPSDITKVTLKCVRLPVGNVNLYPIELFSPPCYPCFCQNSFFSFLLTAVFFLVSFFTLSALPGRLKDERHVKYIRTAGGSFLLTYQSDDSKIVVILKCLSSCNLSWTERIVRISKNLRKSCE